MVVALLGGLTTGLRIRARAEALRDRLADVDLHRRVGELELLRIGIDGDEVDLRDAGVHHPVDRVDAGAADADHADDREVGGDVARDVEPRRALRHRRHEARRRPVRLDRRLRVCGTHDGLGSEARAPASPRPPARRRAPRSAPPGGSPRRALAAEARRPAGRSPVVRPRSRRRARPSRRARSGSAHRARRHRLERKLRRRLRCRRLRSDLRLGRRALGLRPLRRLGRAEELRERALTHARALARHPAPPSRQRPRAPAGGKPPQQRPSGRT